MNNYVQDGAMETLPPRFTLELHDNSTKAPIGTPVVFRRGGDARPTQGVLVRDKRGAFYVREYRLRADGGWTAFAYNEAYPSLESDVDGLEILAVAESIQVGWGDLIR